MGNIDSLLENSGFLSDQSVPGKMEQTNVGDLAGICAGIGVGVLFLLVSKVTEEAIGYGDSVAIMILGGYLGFWKVVGVLAAAFFYKWSLFGDIGISRTGEDDAIFPFFDSWIYSDAGRAEGGAA
mgnify:CR=1 FL=1